ncbi:NERD domain-containing protein [Paraglaciecola sp. 2405UD69-4]|uniref:NERD domain-containing protein n=1 Tax=Paraglaciecola sp. 2405UD69-4 TaxID=3391836 RepID=UPI0039C91434
MVGESKIRTEDEIFNELENLCSTDSFIHVIALFCFKDTFIHTAGEGLTAETLSQQFDKSRLSRTELSSIIGLMCKSNVSLDPLPRDELEECASKIWHLLEELHRSFLGPIDLSNFLTGNATEKSSQTHFMREAIFYAGEGVYKHQYRDLAQIRYKKDAQWILDNKGFNFDDIAKVFGAIEALQINKVNILVNEAKSLALDNYLPIFQFNVSELKNICDVEIEQIESIIEAFSSESNEGMDEFNSIDDFNYKNAFPILKLEVDSYVAFQSYSLLESQYESPFFWFNSDNKYKSIASKNRGAFTEDYTAERLSEVFARNNVYTNIDMFDGRNKAAEIDVLVVFGNTAIVIQAKSKKLTIAARKGNSLQLEEDFKKAVQDAYDQAYLCAKLLSKENVKLKDIDGNIVNLQNDFETIHPICVVSDYYPALAAQAREFLTYTTTEKIKTPYIMDVFLIDLLAEILDTPLFFLDYIRKRADFGDSILSNHELVILSIYLKQNLYFEGKPDLVMLEDDISSDLELAMLARREGEDCPSIPKGMLTIHQGTHIGSIIDDIKCSEEYGLLNLGYHFLSLGEESINMLNGAIEQMINLYNQDKRHHDITIPLLEEKTGLTIHCNEDPPDVAYKKLVTHCEKRKYSIEAETWHGVCFSPTRRRFSFATYHVSAYQQSDEMDRIVADLRAIDDTYKVKNGKVKFPSKSKPMNKRVKIGRNQKCPCGSDKKYKRCCLGHFDWTSTLKL